MIHDAAPLRNRPRGCLYPARLLLRSPMPTVRHDWSVSEIRALHDLPLLELIYRAQTVHREVCTDHKVQLCSLLSV